MATRGGSVRKFFFCVMGKMWIFDLCILNSPNANQCKKVFLGGATFPQHSPGLGWVLTWDEMVGAHFIVSFLWIWLKTCSVNTCQPQSPPFTCQLFCHISLVCDYFWNIKKLPRIPRLWSFFTINNNTNVYHDFTLPDSTEELDSHSYKVPWPCIWQWL